MLTTLIFAHLIGTVEAQESTNIGTYNETEIARNSTLFADAAKSSAPQFAKAESTMNQHASYLSTMETSLAFVGLVESPDWYIQNQKQMLGYRLMVNKHIQLLTTDYDVEFTKAMERAIESLNFDGTIQLCEAQSIHAMMGTAPKCEGVSLSKSISNNIDNDTQLQASLKELNNLQWPEPFTETQSIDAIPLTGSKYYIRTDVIIQKLVNSSVNNHKKWLENKYDSIVEGVENENPEAIKLAVKQRDEYKQRISKTGEQFEEAIELFSIKRAKKFPQLESLAQCHNLQELGGCTGEDITEEFLAFIESEKHWNKSLKKVGLLD